MNQVTRSIILTSDFHYGRRLPSRALGQLLQAVSSVVRQSISMAFRGQGRVTRPLPEWLSAAADIRLVDFQGTDETHLIFEMPTLGEAVPELYRQHEFFWSTPPQIQATGLDLLFDVLTDIADADRDSDHFDATVLRRLCGFRKLLGHPFREVQIIGGRYTTRGPARLSGATLKAARRLYEETPKPQRVRIVGTLITVHQTTLSFVIKPDHGQDVQGILLEGSISDAAMNLNQRVLVVGQAIYRPSGRILRIDADALEPTKDFSSVWSRVPASRNGRKDLGTFLQDRVSKNGAGTIIGQWPGDETDEEIEAWLERIS